MDDHPGGLAPLFDDAGKDRTYGPGASGASQLRGKHGQRDERGRTCAPPSPSPSRKNIRELTRIIFNLDPPLVAPRLLFLTEPIPPNAVAGGLNHVGLGLAPASAGLNHPVPRPRPSHAVQRAGIRRSFNPDPCGARTRPGRARRWSRRRPRSAISKHPCLRRPRSKTTARSR